MKLTCILGVVLATLMLEGTARALAPHAVGKAMATKTIPFYVERSPTLRRIRDSNVVRIAHPLGVVPFAFLNEEKQPVGYSIDLCKHVVETMRRTFGWHQLRIEYVPVTANAQRLTNITEGKADLDCSNASNTAERRKLVSFGMTHFITGGRLLVQRDAKLTRLIDAAGATIVVSKGSTHADYLGRMRDIGLFQGKVLEVADARAAFALVRDGTAQAMLHQEVLLASLRAGADDPDAFRIVGSMTLAECLAIMFRKDDYEFKRFVDITVGHWMIDGHAQNAYRRWFGSPITPKGVNLALPLNGLLEQQFRFPSDKVGDDLQ